MEKLYMNINDHKWSDFPRKYDKYIWNLKMKIKLRNIFKNYLTFEKEKIKLRNI